MTWTYDIALTETRDQVRFLVGDTDTADQMVQDEEINWAITSEGSVFASAALVAETLSGKFSSQVDKSVGDLKLKFGDRADRFATLAKTLRARVSLNVRFHTAGAESISSKDVDESDRDLVDPFFRRGMHDNVHILGADDRKSILA